MYQRHARINYPMTFNQAPSPNHQIEVWYKGKKYLQGMSPNRGPYMYPISPFHQSYINHARKF